MRVVIVCVAWVSLFALPSGARADQPQNDCEQRVADELAEIKQSLRALGLQVDALQRERAGAAANPQQADQQRMYPMSYVVSDLVPEIRGDFAVAWDPKHLVRYITTHIAPQQWEEAGGPGTVRVYHANRSLVITQAAEVHQELGQWFKQLRATKLVLDEVAGFSKPQPVKQAAFNSK